MNTQALLHSIEATGQSQLTELRENTKKQVEKILTEARETAEQQRQTAYQEALQPLQADSAQRLHQAHMEAVAIRAAARNEIVKRLFQQIHTRLKTLSRQANYPKIFQQLLVEAVQTLGEKELNDNMGHSDNSPCLEINGRDEGLAHEVLQKLGIKMRIAPTLSTWGGVVIRSSDGRVVVTNTFESRLEQLNASLAQFVPENDWL